MEIDAFKQAVHRDKLLCDIFDCGDGFAHELAGVLAPEGVGFDWDDGRFGIYNNSTGYSKILLQLGLGHSMPKVLYALIFWLPEIQYTAYSDGFVIFFPLSYICSELIPALRAFYKLKRHASS